MGGVSCRTGDIKVQCQSKGVRVARIKENGGLIGYKGLQISQAPVSVNNLGAG